MNAQAQKADTDDRTASCLVHALYELVASAKSRKMRAAIVLFVAIATVLVDHGSAVSQCPEPEGLQLYPHATSCDQFWACANGTLTLETCPNGLLFDGLGGVAHYCRYEWQADCGDRKERAPPISTEYCPWLYGIYPITSTCNTQFHTCVEGEPIVTDCEPGLAYDDRIHGCNWPDLLEGCDGPTIVGFQCPEKVTGLSARFIPNPRFPYPGDCTRYITCVDNYKPRLNGCGHESGFNPDTLACEDIKNLPGCHGPSF